jgi:protocatechuate 3,4-dioxygenase beta subunit
MNYETENRRDFLKRASMAALAFPLLIGCETDSLAQKNSSDVLSLLRRNAQGRGSEGMGAIEVPDSVSWRTAFNISKGDGEPMVISGTVFKPDGKTPAPNTLIYFYHTDKYGIYGREDQPKHGRYRGWMLTDAKGRYEFSSIRPASYPNSTQSQHVHMTITTPEAREDWIDSILFEGDKFLTLRERERTGKRGGFNPIVKLAPGKDGIMRAVRDIQLVS